MPFNALFLVNFVLEAAFTIYIYIYIVVLNP